MNKLDKDIEERFDEKFPIEDFGFDGVVSPKEIKSFIATILAEERHNWESEQASTCYEHEQKAYEKGLNESKVGETKRIWYSKGFDAGVNDERQAIVEECERLIKNIKHDDNWQDYTYNIDPVESSKKSALTSIQDFINKRK